MILDLYCTGHTAFCRNPLHPGPCKGWRKGKVTSTSERIRQRVESTGQAHVSPVRSIDQIGKPSTRGAANYAVAPNVMEKEWAGHWASLSTKQKDAVEEYSGGGYSDMNTALRKPADEWDDFEKDVIHQAALVQSAMAPAPRGTKVFRGMGLAGLGLPGNATIADLEKLVGNTLVNDAFTSTTVDRKAQFHGDVKLEIEVPKGTPSLWLGSNSQWPKEQELLLAAGAKMKVVGATEIPGQPGKYTVKVRVVP